MIVVAGESLIDLLVRPDGAVEAVPGGGPFNTARALARLGVPTAFVGRLSSDRFGRILRERLVSVGVDVRWAVETDDPTLLAIAELDEAGAATYRFHATGTAAAGLTSDDLPTKLPAEVSAVHVGTLGLMLEPMASAVEHLVGLVADDVLVFLDLNIRPAAITDAAAYRARLDRVVARTDVVKASVDDLGWLSPGLPAEVAATALARDHGAVVLVTDGGHPVRVVRAGGVEAIPVPVVPVVDTVGAGDAFGAGFLAAWHRDELRRRDLATRDAVALATALAIRVGAASTMRAGANPPTAAELDALAPAPA
jgi:fructokinase